ncbi:DUF4124 domain-containing protein [Pseudoalteromonas sp. MMG010]|uniref:DUF4124 domain-containing protein n=1 Tax=Pseudoalteromonas sp. MMG010 TaxID=2822685 RepID=UPI001FFC9562|nr:DUF4124 domain-containing protein [Pseudoalteromonas sp. MMG010]
MHYFFIITFTILFSTTSQANTTYYKCVTVESTTFSQFPCQKNAKSYTITNTQDDITGPTKNVTKALNSLERKRIIKDLEKELKSNKNKLILLNREKDQQEFKQHQRLNHTLSEQDKKQLAKDINKNLSNIAKHYKTQVKNITKRINKLENKIKLYQ